MRKNIVKKYTEEEKIRAAYVLNMCTVSVSQIVDYDDEYVLEQEYEAILNNLNLEQMPKDEALLNILKELLDTITFFRIYYKKKAMIEKKYQQKVKNAIWNAVPNFGLLVAGGNPITMAVSLASSVGIGYMNYRREKAENALDYENEMMSLQITAIEQLNALKRELFTTSWRLADEYNFSDKYRLTERQIEQYNEILMDQDFIRRYRRLDSIKEYFLAYPVFWYFLGNAANQISREVGDVYTEEFKNEYKKIAMEHFDYFFRMNEYSVLREDQLVSSCALEYFELLPESELDKKNELLEKAVQWSGMKKDILQICAIDYLRLKNYSEAEKLMGILVNEGYNPDINAQILSSIYAFHYFDNPSDKVLFDYVLLSKQQSTVTLFPLPIYENEGKNEIQLWDGFIQQQRSSVHEIHNRALRKYFASYAVKVNGLLMNFDEAKDYPEIFFQPEGKQMRDDESDRVFRNEIRRLSYIESLQQKNYTTEVVSILNDMLMGMRVLSISMDAPVNYLREALKAVTGIFDKIQEHITKGEIDKKTYNDLFKKVDFFALTADLQDNVYEQVSMHMRLLNDMRSIIIAESLLRKFCDRNGISLTVDNMDDYEENPKLDPYRLDPSLVGKVAQSFDKEKQCRSKMTDKLKAELKNVVKETDKVSTRFCGDEGFNTYFSSKGIIGKIKDKYYEKALAILDDKRRINDIDLIFTVNSVIPIKSKVPKSPVGYKHVKWNDEEKALDLDGLSYKNPNVNTLKLAKLVENLETIRAEYND